MNATVLRRFLIAGAVGTGFLVQPNESQAIFHWFKSCCQPAVPCAAPVQVAQYVPTTAYRTQYVNVPVTTMRPISSCGPCGQQVSYMPVTTMTTQAQLVPYTTYRIVYSNVVAAQPVIPVQPVVANYAVPVATAAPAAPVATVVPATPVAPAGCSSCGGGGAPVAASTYYRAPTAYSAYSAPVYNGAGFGPPSAGMPLENSSGNLMQSATSGSSLRGVAPTLSPGSPFASGTSPVAPVVPMPAQPQVMPGQTIQAPAAAQPQQQYSQPQYSQPQASPPAPQYQSTPSQSSPAQPNGASGAAPQTYADESTTNGTNGTNGAARPVTPPYNHNPAPQESSPPAPVQPIPREESSGTPTDPTSGPSIFPPASRTTQLPANQNWAYTRLSYLPGETSARQVSKIPATVDTRPTTNADGWRASSR